MVYLGLESFHFGARQGVGLRNHGNYVHLSLQLLHQLNVNWPQTATTQHSVTLKSPQQFISK